MAHCSTVLSQIVRIFPRHEFQSLGQSASRGAEVPLIFPLDSICRLADGATGQDVIALRDVVDNLSAQGQKALPSRNQGLQQGDAGSCNEQQPHTLYEELFKCLLARCQAMAHATKRSNSTARSTFWMPLWSNLTLSLFPWAKYQKSKGAAKLHIGLDADGYLPAFVDLSEGKEHEINRARSLELPKGSYVVFDRGYTDYTWYQDLCSDGVFFVTRLKSNAVADAGTKASGPQEPRSARRPGNSSGQAARDLSAGHLLGCRNRHHLSIRDQCPGDSSADRRRSVQGTLADRTLLQMDQAKSESEEFSGDLQERREDPALDRPVCLPGSVVSEVPVESRRVVTAHVANITAQFVRETRFDGATQAKTADKPITRQSVTAHLKL